MALGGVQDSVTSGSGPSGSGPQGVKNVLVLGMCTGGTVNQLYSPVSRAGVSAGLDVGPLAEEVAALLAHGAGQVYAVPLNPSTPGGLSAAVTQKGTGLATVTPACAPHKAILTKCTTGGALGTAAFAFSLDGGLTWSTPVVSVTGSTWAYPVPGTFCTLTFATATYVATKTLTVGTDGTVTPGSAWVGTVTQASSPVDNYEMVCSVDVGGALGTARLIVYLDGGPSAPNGYGGGSTLPAMLSPSGGVIVIPGTGVYLTLATGSGNFVAGDTYSFNCKAPTCSSSDITAAINAAATAQGSPVEALVHVNVLPGSASGAFSAGSTIDAAVANARANNGKKWQWTAECPCSSGGNLGGDIILSGGAAVVDTADTESAIKTARAGSTYNYGSVWVGTHRSPSYLGGGATGNLRRGTGWILAMRYVENTPDEDPAHVALGPLDVFQIGRDESKAATTLIDAQLNVLTTYPSKGGGAYIAVEKGGFGWRNLNTDPNFQDANSVRVLNHVLAAVDDWAIDRVAERINTKGDGTIAEKPRQALSAAADAVGKRAAGLIQGGDFPVSVASAFTATVLATSQLGNSPHELDVQYELQRKGFVSNVNQSTYFSGTLTSRAA